MATSKMNSKGTGIGGHTRPIKGLSDCWITPRWLLLQLGPFDLDPCAATPQPWPCAERQFTLRDDGLSKPWEGRVWLNPPYSQAGKWLQRLSEHQCGTALIFARTETAMFFEQVWRKAHALLFLEGRLYFHRPDGTLSGNAGGPSVLVAYGEADAQILYDSQCLGHFVRLR